jgi:hypothetical protein
VEFAICDLRFAIEKAGARWVCFVKKDGGSKREDVKREASKCWDRPLEGARRWWVCFVKNFAWRRWESGDFEELEGVLGLKGGFDWVCFLVDGVGGLWIVACRAGEDGGGGMGGKKVFVGWIWAMERKNGIEMGLWRGWVKKLRRNRHKTDRKRPKPT